MEINDSVLRRIVEEVIKGMAAPSAGPAARPATAGEGEVALVEKGPAQQGRDATEVVVGITPAFGKRLTKSIIGVPYQVIIRELLAGIEEGGAKSRVIRVMKTADCAFVGYEAAKLSGSGVGVGVQTRGTAVIHHKDLLPLSNLELFSQSPVMTGDVFRAIGRNAARYAKGETPVPVPTLQDPMARPRYQAKSAVMHTEECKFVVDDAKSIELEVQFKGGN